LLRFGFCGFLFLRAFHSRIRAKKKIEDCQFSGPVFENQPDSITVSVPTSMSFGSSKELILIDELDGYQVLQNRNAPIKF
jgi:hypothetical protein